MNPTEEKIDFFLKLRYLTYFRLSLCYTIISKVNLLPNILSEYAHTYRYKEWLGKGGIDELFVRPSNFSIHFY